MGSPVSLLASYPPVAVHQKSLDLGRRMLSEEEIIKTVGACKRLEFLNLEGSTLLTNRGLEVIAKQCSDIEEIDLSGCSQITAAGVKSVLEHCRKLARLHLRHCRLEGDLSGVFTAHPSLQSVLLPWGERRAYRFSAPTLAKASLEDDLAALSLEEALLEGKERKGDAKGIASAPSLPSPRCNYAAQPTFFRFDKTHKKGRGVWRMALFQGMVLSASYDHRIGIWDPQSRRNGGLLAKHTREALALVPTHDGRGFLSGSSDGTMVLWGADFRVQRVFVGHFSGIYSIAHLPSGAIVTGSCQCPPGKVQWDYDMRIWDSHRGRIIGKLKGHKGAVAALDVMEDGTLISGSADHTVKLWDVTTGKCKKTLSYHKDYVYCVKALGSGLIASGSRDSRIIIWNSKTEKLQKLEGHISTVYSLALVTPTLLASASRDGTVTIWNIETGEYVHVLEHPGKYVYSVTVSPSGDVVAGLSSGEVVIWKFPLAAPGV